MLRPLLLCTAIAMAAPAAALAQASPTGAAPPSASDYVTAAGQSDQFEIQEGQLAAGKATSADIRKFGSEMVKDHTKSTQIVLAAAQKSGLPTPPPPALRPDQAQMISQLQSASGADFDRTYLTQQLQAHQEALALQSGYAQNGDDKNLKAAAGKITPVVQKHLAMLQKMQGGGSMSGM